MSWKVELETRAKRALLKLSHPIQEIIAEVIDDLAQDPFPPGIKKLLGQNGFRIRKGAYRLLYTVDPTQKLVRIYRIGHRREVYR